jgi:hypothetical protein
MRARSFGLLSLAAVSVALLALSFACNDPPKASWSDASASSGSDAAADTDAATTVMKAIPVPTASVLAVVNPYGSPAYSGPTGSVEGTISYTGEPPADQPTNADPTKCPRAEAVYGKKFRLGDSTAQGKELLDAIVAVTGYKDVYVPEKRESVAVEIDGCAITPRTITLTFGQKLDIKNKGPEIIAPVIDQGGSSVMMVAVPRAPDPISLYPKKPGRFGLTDHLGKAFMLNDVYVLLHPLHAVSDAHGHYRIDGVPVGKLLVNATHPAFSSETNQPIEIFAGVVAKADLLLTPRKRDGGAAPAPTPSSSIRPPR